VLSDHSRKGGCRTHTLKNGSSSLAYKSSK
jgi:hypothetical protein